MIIYHIESSSSNRFINTGSSYSGLFLVTNLFGGAELRSFYPAGQLSIDLRVRI